MPQNKRSSNTQTRQTGGSKSSASTAKTSTAKKKQGPAAGAGSSAKAGKSAKASGKNAGGQSRDGARTASRAESVQTRVNRPLPSNEQGSLRAPLLDASTHHDILGVFLGVLGIATMIAVLTPSTGALTTAISNFLHQVFGLGAFVVPLMLIVWAVTFFTPVSRVLPGRAALGLSIVAVAIISLVGILTPGAADDPTRLFNAYVLADRGGYLGNGISWALLNLVGLPIGVVVIVGLSITGIVVIGFSITELFETVGLRARERREWARIQAQERAARRAQEREQRMIRQTYDGYGAGARRPVTGAGFEPNAAVAPYGYSSTVLFDPSQPLSMTDEDRRNVVMGVPTSVLATAARNGLSAGFESNAPTDSTVDAGPWMSQFGDEPAMRRGASQYVGPMDSYGMPLDFQDPSLCEGFLQASIPASVVRRRGSHVGNPAETTFIQPSSLLERLEDEADESADMSSGAIGMNRPAMNVVGISPSEAEVLRDAANARGENELEYIDDDVPVAKSRPSKRVTWWDETDREKDENDSYEPPIVSDPDLQIPGLIAGAPSARDQFGPAGQKIRSAGPDAAPVSSESGAGRVNASSVSYRENAFDVEEVEAVDTSARFEPEAEMAPRKGRRARSAGSAAGDRDTLTTGRRGFSNGDSRTEEFDEEPAEGLPWDEPQVRESNEANSKGGEFVSPNRPAERRNRGDLAKAHESRMTLQLEQLSSTMVAPAGAPTEFVLPDPSILRRNTNGLQKSDKERAESAEMAARLQQTLEEFRVHAEVVDWVDGPTCTTYEVQPGEGVRVSKFTSLEDDIARSLARESVRIYAPVHGTSYVGIEVPNTTRQTVMFGDILPQVTGGPLDFAVGLDANGKPVHVDLAGLPHLLIAGTTGSGKSVMMNAIICSMLMRDTPGELRMIMIDPKQVELSVYNGIPHLIMPVVADPRQAAAALQWGVTEMDRRYQVFANLKVRQLAAYNELVDGPENAQREFPLKRLPSVVIIIDELTDLMMVAKKDVEASIVRIAQLGRAAGIHLVMATQRPSADVVTGLIKANVSNRMGLKVATGIDSKVVLDQTGAEKLLGNGDMLFLRTAWGDRPRRLQGCFLSDGEIAQIVEHLKTQAAPASDVGMAPLNPNGHGLSSGSSAEGEAGIDNDDDPLALRAAQIVVEYQMGSTSMIQRKLKLGYARAGRVMDMLEEMGVVGPARGSKPRDVLIHDMDELANIFGNQTLEEDY